MLKMWNLHREWWSTIPPISTKRRQRTIWRCKYNSWLGTATKMWRQLSRLMGTQSSSTDNWIANGNTQLKQTIKKPAQNHLHKTPKYFHKNEWQHKLRRYNSRVNEYSKDMMVVLWRQCFESLFCYVLSNLPVLMIMVVKTCNVPFN